MPNHGNLKSPRSTIALPLALAFSVTLWPILMLLSQPQGDLTGQLNDLASGFSLYRLNFIIATFIAPLASLFLICSCHSSDLAKKTPRLDFWGRISLLPYTLFVSISYVSQYTLLPRRLSEGIRPETLDWYFNDPGSLPYFLNQLGYAFFALSALAIAYKLLYASGLPRIIGILLYVSAFFSLLAFAGLILEHRLLNFATLLSGALILPVSILAVVWKLKSASPGPYAQANVRN